MKKLLALILSLMMAFTLASCGDDTPDTPDTSVNENDSDTTDTEEAGGTTDTEGDTDAAGDTAADTSADTTAEKPGPSLVGSWNYAYVIDDVGDEYDFREYFVSLGYVTEEEAEAMVVTYTFNADGTCQISVDDVSVDGSYYFDGKTVRIVTPELDETTEISYDAATDRLVSVDESIGATLIITRK